MKQRLTIEEVRKEFEKRGYILLEDIYLNNHTKMKAINQEGYFISTNVNNLKLNKNTKIFHSNNPYTIENIKLYLKKNNISLEIISVEYKDIKSKLLFKSSEGYLISNTLDNIITTHSFAPFHTRNKYTIHNIKIYLSNNNIPYELLSNKYKNNEVKLKWKCDKGHIFEMNWLNFQDGNRCPTCAIERTKEKLKLPLEEAKQIFIDAGYEPLFEIYNNSNEKLAGKTIEGYLIYSTVGRLKNKKASLFHKANPYTIYNIKLWLQINNISIELLSDKYISNKKLLKWKCKERNHIFEMSWDNFLQGQRCHTCYLETHQGKNHPNYKPSKTDEERMFNRYQLYGLYMEKWRVDIFIRDNRICQCCNIKKRKINAHHLNSWNWAIDQRFDIDNGITLCEDCHKLFHKLYGRGNNTKEQYEEFVKMFNNVESDLKITS